MRRGSRSLIEFASESQKQNLNSYFIVVILDGFLT